MAGNTSVFVLLTDFGLADPYAGQLKAALFSRAPTVPILDLSHGVPPFAVHTGAFFLASSLPFYPDGSVFLCVVDPGVGSPRDLLLVRGKQHTLLGPDNGLLSLACKVMERDGPLDAWTLNFPASIAAGTFHGRDILAPAAAALALGAKPSSLGTRLERSLFQPEWAKPAYGVDAVTCTVLHVDVFGNCLCNLPAAADLPEGQQYRLDAAGKTVDLACAGHYAELAPGRAGLIRGSQGYCEIACNGSSASAAFGLVPGCAFRILSGVA